MSQPILSRRKLIVGSGALTLLAAVDAFALEPNWLRVTEHSIPVRGLPRTLDGYQVAQITDAHLRHIGPVEEHIIREIRNREVPLVVLTGDMIDDSSRLHILEEFCSHFRGDQRTVLAALGNWEHWARIPTDRLRSVYQASNVNLLINESIVADSAIRVVVTDDATGGTVRINEAIRDNAARAASLFLTHSPELLDRLPKMIGRFDLVLAGHTHGGQGRLGPFAPMRPPGSGRFISGWYEVPIGRAYVSCGTGTSVVPARFACRPELPIFTLRQG